MVLFAVDGQRSPVQSRVGDRRRDEIAPGKRRDAARSAAAAWLKPAGSPADSCVVHDGATTSEEETVGASLRVRWQMLSDEGAALRLASQGVWDLHDKNAVAAFWARLEVHLGGLRQFAADLDAFQAKYGHRLGLDA